MEQFLTRQTTHVYCTKKKEENTPLDQCKEAKDPNSETTEPINCKQLQTHAGTGAMPQCAYLNVKLNKCDGAHTHVGNEKVHVCALTDQQGVLVQWLWSFAVTIRRHLR